MKNRTFLQLAFLIISSAILISCGQTKPPLAVNPEPALAIVEEQGTNEFSLVLDDMDVVEDENNIVYRHKYLVLNPKEDRIETDSTGWVNVNESFFNKHENDLGMELISYHDGVLTDTPKPVGFDWAIGNEEHGEWVVDSTSNNGTQNERQWRYRPGSFFLTYWLLSRTTRYGTYSNYATNYRGRSAFYGSGADTYGTNSSYQRANRAKFYTRKSSNATWQKQTQRKARSSSRYSGSSKTRGRSGGVGK
jgi:hypothetical protein